MSKTESPPPAELLLVEEVAAALRVSKMSVYREIKAGNIQVVAIGRTIRVPRSELDRLLTPKALTA